MTGDGKSTAQKPRPLLLAALVLSCLAGCSPAPRPQQPTPGQAAVAATRDAGLPPCPSPTGAQPPTPFQDCFLQSRDRVGLRFEVRHSPQRSSPSPAQRTAQIRVLDKTATLVQTIVQDLLDPGMRAESRSLFPPSAEPSLADLDQDGREELVVPVGGLWTGADRKWLVWRATADNALLRSQPEMFGLATVYDPDGYLVLIVQGGYTSTGYVFFQTSGQDWRKAATAQVEPQTGAARSCAADLAGGSSALGMTAQRAEQYFCARAMAQRLR